MKAQKEQEKLIDKLNKLAERANHEKIDLFKDLGIALGFDKPEPKENKNDN
jgi:hypothetical protein